VQLRNAAIAVFAAAVLGLAACGGESESDAKKDIAGAVKDAVVGQNLKARCEEATTKDFIRRVYGNVGQCRRAEKPEPDDEPPTDVQVSGVKIDGEQATARVRYVGGNTDGSEGAFEFRKEEGKWRIDDLGVDFLRSQVERGLKSDDQESAVLRDPKVRECARKALAGLPDDQLKRVAYAEISKRTSAQKDVARVVTPCLSQAGSGTGSGNASFLREKFEQGVAKGARRNGVPKATIDCINEKLRSSISDEEIQQTAASGGKTSAELRRKATEAVTACRAG